MNRAAVYDWPNDMNLLLTQRGDDSEDFAVLPQTSLHQIQHYGLLDCRDLELARFGVTFNGEKLCILVVTNRGPVQVFVEKAHFSGSGLVPIFARCEYCDEVYPYDIIEHKFIGLGGVGDGCCPDCGLDLDVDM